MGEQRDNSIEERSYLCGIRERARGKVANQEGERLKIFIGEIEEGQAPIVTDLVDTLNPIDRTRKLTAQRG